MLIAVSDDGGPLIGIIDQSYVGERFEGGFGRGVMRGPRGYRELSVRGTRTLEQAIPFYTLPEIGAPDELAALERLSARALLTPIRP